MWQCKIFVVRVYFCRMSWQIFWFMQCNLLFVPVKYVKTFGTNLQDYGPWSQFGEEEDGGRRDWETDIARQRSAQSAWFRSNCCKTSTWRVWDIFSEKLDFTLFNLCVQLFLTYPDSLRGRSWLEVTVFEAQHLPSADDNGTWRLIFPKSINLWSRIRPLSSCCWLHLWP